MKKFDLWKPGILFLLLLATGCNKGGEIEAPRPPVITLDSETGIYTVKVGGQITIDPTVENAEDAAYAWIREGKVVATGPAYLFIADEAGQFYMTFRVETPYGKDEEELRVDVGELALPRISFAAPASGLNLKAGVDYVFAPDIQNGENAVFVWTLDGVVVGDGPAYTFNRAEPGECELTLKAANADGEAEKTLKISVVDRRPLKVMFEKATRLASSADLPVFEGGTVYVCPVVEGAEKNTVYRWKVDGTEVPDAGARYAFTPSGPGRYAVEVTVTDDDPQQRKTLSRNLTETGSAVASASVTVVCLAGDGQGKRPATGTSAAACDRVYEYLPAPGQFVNDGMDGITTQEAANRWAEGQMVSGGYVSLGGFGGYLVVGFDHSIENRGGYNGYDFAVDGNQFEESSEPGIVWVMQDVNGNGLPDDVWYELKGSGYGKPETLSGYAVTYYRPQAPGMNTLWSDNRGGTGKISYLPEFHRQDYYYPAWISEAEYTLRGTCLPARNREVDGSWINDPYEWGYADNYGSDRLSQEDNPSADAVSVYFKIGNAVNPDGTPARLDYIDFVKIQTGVNAQCGWIGEVSTEVFSVKDVNL